MSRTVVLIVAVLLAFSIHLPSRAGAMPTTPLVVLPEDCRISGGKELLLTVDGSLPPNTVLNWEASDGGITSVLPGSDAIFVAPYASTVVTITASLSPAIPGMDNVITRQCRVTSPTRAPDGVASTPSLSFPVN